MDAISRIDRLVKCHPAVLFLKGTPKRPLSEGSMLAVRALNGCLEQVHLVDITRDPEIRAFLPKYADLEGFPQFYLQGDLIGGHEVMLELAERGELCRMLESIHQQWQKAS